MAKLVSMKMSAAEAKEMNAPPSTSASKGPRYPYGLQLRLGPDEIEKLGLEGGIEVGSTVKIDATAIVTEYSERESLNGDEHCSLEIQITDLSIEEPAAQRKERKRGEQLDRLGSDADGDDGGDY